MRTPPVVSAEEWNAAREELLRKEKEHTRAKDALAAERRRLPWVRVEKQYTFEGPDGKGGPARPVRGAPPADRLPALLRARASPTGPRAAAAAARCSPTTSATSPTSTPATSRSCWSPPLRRPTSSATASAWAGTTCPGTRRRTTSRGLRRRRVLRPQRLHPRRRRDLPHLLHQRALGGADRQRLEPARHHPARPPRGVGGLAGGLSAGTAVPWWRRHDEYGTAVDAG